MRLGYPSFKVHLREMSGFPEITVAVMQVTSVRADVVQTSGGTLDRAVINTTNGGVIKTTETYADVLLKMARS